MLPQAPWLCWFIPIIGAALTPLFAMVHHKLRNYGAVAFIGISAIFSISMIPYVFVKNIVDLHFSWIPHLGINLGVLIDPLSVFMANVVSCIGLLISIYSLEYMRGEPSLTRYWFLMQFFIGGMILLVMADNFLQLYIGWEIVGICSYALIGFWYEDSYNAHCGMKAFMMTRIGDVAFLVSILIIYLHSGTFNLMNLQHSTRWIAELSRSGLLLTTALMLFSGPIGKSAQFPLHEWLPEAMAGPTTVSALIHAATMVNAGVYLVARVLPIFHQALWVKGFNELITFFSIVAWVGAFTALLAASMGMVQKEIKKVLAYSTISQLGYMMLALGVSGLMIEPVAGYFASTLHLMAHAVFKALLFLSAGAVLHATHSKEMFDMGGIRSYMPITFKCMIVGTLSLSGIPPLSGFWTKEAIFGATWKLVQEASKQEEFILMLSAYGLLFFAAAAAAMTFFYSLRMIGITFLGRRSKHIKNLEQEGKPVHEVSPVMWVPIGILALSTVVMGVLGPFIIMIFQKFFSPIFVYSVVPEGLVDILKHAFLSPTFGITCSALLIGGFPAYKLYITRQVDPVKLTEKYPPVKRIHAFLWNRWYINAFYYKVFVHGTIMLSRGAHHFIEISMINRANYAVANFFKRLSLTTYKYIEFKSIEAFSYSIVELFGRLSETAYKYAELKGVESFSYAVAMLFRRLSGGAYKRAELRGIDAFNDLVVNAATRFSQYFKKTHTGVLSYNMIAVFISIVLLIVLVLLFGGV